MKYRVDIHFGDRTPSEIEKIAKTVARLLRMDVYVVKDYTTERLGVKVPPKNGHIEGDWRDHY
jgi:hypothetical protein